MKRWRSAFRTERRNACSANFTATASRQSFWAACASCSQNPPTHRPRLGGEVRQGEPQLRDLLGEERQARRPAPSRVSTRLGGPDPSLAGAIRSDLHAGDDLVAGQSF